MVDTRAMKGAPARRTSARSEAMRERAHLLIPGGAHTYSKGDDQFPANAPAFIQSGRGVSVWDSDGNEYLDWGMGLRSVILGHAYPTVTAAAAAELDRGSNFVRPSPLEVQLAERLVELIPCAEMVKLAKNGSDVTTAALRLARAATGREIVACANQPFFSVDDWFIGTTSMASGVPDATTNLTRVFRYNDLESLRRLFQENPGRIAAVILEAMTLEEPATGFLEGVRQLCTANGSVMIFDEIITGFRFGLRGAQHRFGVIPDLATFGKGLGNGFSVAALVGRRDIMELGGLRHSRPRVFLLSTTHGGETHAIAAALATLREVEDKDVPAHLSSVGADLVSAFREAAAGLGIEAHARALGATCSPAFAFHDRSGQPSAALRTLFMQEMVERGVLMPYIAPSFSHDADSVGRSAEAMRGALAIVREGIERGAASLIEGAVLKPVFRPYN
jgi:glutamate-1-semialdehyde 2,1-aminomutase